MGSHSPITRASNASEIEPVAIVDDPHLSQEKIEWINKRLTPVPTNPSLDPIKIDRSAGIERNYFFCEQTPPFFPSEYTRARFDREGVEYEIIDSGHDCNLTHPKMVAEILLRY